jgi:hypothetical protein
MVMTMISCNREGAVKVYEVKCVQSGSISIDGTINDNAWKKATTLDDFLLPWEDGSPAATSFRAMYDTAMMYFCFDARDKDLVVMDSLLMETDIAKGDRVELFLSPDTTMQHYFCIEIDPRGRLLDYAASYYRNFDDKWNVQGIIARSQVSDESYQVEVAIPLTNFRKMGIDLSKDVYIGVFRAQLEKNGAEVKEHWLTWIDPSTAEPDFHVPGALGVFRFQK